MSPISNIWPEWTIEKQIGRGTYGTVYQAVRQENDVISRAAIKAISIPQDPCELDSLKADGLDLQATRSYLKRIVEDFSNEIRLMVSLKGAPNIVSIEDYRVVEKQDALGWDIFIRMELLTPLNTYICDKKLTEQEIIRLGCDICTALMTCSRNKIIHRDIKPENVFINRFGTFKLGDFGTARNMESLTGGLSQKGTFNYMAPEVLNGTTYDSRVDVYSLGLMLYRLTNGNRLPFLSEKQLLSPSERRNAFDRRIRGDNLPPPCCASHALAEVILKATAFRPEDRYGNAAELRSALMRLSREGIADEETNQIFSSAEEVPMKPEQAEAAPKKPVKKTERRRASKSRGDSGFMRMNAPAMSIDAPQYRISSSDSSVQNSKKITAPVLISILLLLLITAAGILIHRFGNWPVDILTVQYPANMTFEYGEKLDTSQIKLHVLYRDGTREYIDSGFSCSPMVPNTVGRQKIRVSYWTADSHFFVNVDNPIKSITVNTPPEKTKYAVGDNINLQGLSLMLHYADGTTETTYSGFTCDRTVFDSAGTVDVNVKFIDLETSFQVDVVSPVSIRIASLPDKTTYKIGENLNISGIEVAVEYSDGTSEIIPYGFTCAPNAFGRTGIHNVAVSYKDLIAFFPVEVIKLESISMISPPEKTEYYVGEAMSIKGLVLEGTYSDGSTEVLTAPVYCQYLYYNHYHNADNLLIPGKIEVLIGCEGFDVPFYINVLERERPAEQTEQKESSEEEPKHYDIVTLPNIQPQEGDDTIDFSTLQVNLSGWANRETGEGVNENGQTVNWCLWIELDVPESLTKIYKGAAVCSWGDVLTAEYSDDTLDFSDAKKGITFLQFGLYEDQNSLMDRFVFMLMLPDDPSIEGQQTVTIAIGPYRQNITVDLKYAGNYETGTGWQLKKVTYA